MACLPAVAQHGAPLAPARSRARGYSSRGSTSGSSSTKGLHLKDVHPLDATKVELAAHLITEAKELQATARSDNPITELRARPLVQSTAIWLVSQGVVNKEDNPGVIQRVGELLHEYIPLHFCHIPKNKTMAVDFATRIYAFMQNHMTRNGADFTLQVAHDADLNTPMKALEDAGMIDRLAEGEIPAQGHSARSIYGKRKVCAIDVPELAEEATSGEPQQQTRSGPPPSSKPSNAQPSGTNPLSAAAMLTELARHAGLDISVGPPGRAAEASSLPHAHNDADSTGGAPPADEPPPAGGGGSRGRRRARGGKEKSTAQESLTPAPAPAPTPAPTAAPAPEKFNPSIAFEQSKSHAAVRATGPVQVGNKVAYYLVLPDNLGGTEWYVGEVVRVSRGHWVDVKFVDGALWCSFKETERGLRWVIMEQ